MSSARNEHAPAHCPARSARRPQRAGRAPPVDGNLSARPSDDRTEAEGDRRSRGRAPAGQRAASHRRDSRRRVSRQRADRAPRGRPTSSCSISSPRSASTAFTSPAASSSTSSSRSPSSCGSSADRATAWPRSSPSRNVRHISLGRLIPLDTRWRAQQWPDAPTAPLDPDYAESILRAQQTFEDTAAGKPIDVVTVRDLVQLLIHKVARSNAALGQILAVKQYENLTYCHSVNVSVLSLLLGKQVGLDESDAGGAGRSRAAARRRQDADPARDRQEGRRARQARAQDHRVAHDARRRDPRADRRAASADADRRARTSPRRQGHRAIRISATRSRIP